MKTLVTAIVISTALSAPVFAAGEHQQGGKTQTHQMPEGMKM